MVLLRYPCLEFDILKMFVLFSNSWETTFLDLLDSKSHPISSFFQISAHDNHITIERDWCVECTSSLTYRYCHIFSEHWLSMEYDEWFVTWFFRLSLGSRKWIPRVLSTLLPVTCSQLCDHQRLPLVFSSMTLSSLVQFWSLCSTRNFVLLCYVFDFYSIYCTSYDFLNGHTN